MVSVAVPGMIASKTAKKSGQVLQEQFGYNFIDLVTKLALFYVISFLIAKYMEAVIYFQGGLSTIAGFFGIKLVQADQLPSQWVSLFVDTDQKTYSATPTAPGQFNPPGWDRSYDYGTPEHQQAEPHLFPQKEQQFRFWDLINAIAIFYISWEAYKYWKRGGEDFLTLGIFGLLIAVLSVLSFSRFLNRFSLNRFQEANK
jgi:hypothetical protein|tara:strand:+ start:105 stop:704 length:600 start_codon:yes stop_codon:yes gene_type:complete